MDLLNIIISSVCALLGALGGGGVLYWKQNKMLKQQEAKQAEHSTQHAYVEEWKELYQKKEERVNILEEKLDDMRQKKNKSDERITQLQLENERLQWAKCTVNGCNKRQPPHYYDGDGNEVLPKQCSHCQQQ